MNANDNDQTEAAPTDLGGGVTRIDGPNGAIVYTLHGKPLLARSPLESLSDTAVTAFLTDHNVDQRIDLRDPAATSDNGTVTAPWDTRTLPIDLLDPLPDEQNDHAWTYLRHTSVLTTVARTVQRCIDAGHVPVIHCHEGIDRTGAVVALLLAPHIGHDRAAGDYVHAALRVGQHRQGIEITPLLERAESTPSL